jgi:hypothetical protein
MRKTESHRRCCVAAFLPSASRNVCALPPRRLPDSSNTTQPCVQKFDWIKDATPEEEALMKARMWDTEEAALGPVDERYLQPELKVLEEDYEMSMRTAREADRLAKSYTEGAEVRVQLCMQARRSCVGAQACPQTARVCRNCVNLLLHGSPACASTGSSC